MKSDNIVKQCEDPAACMYLTAPTVRAMKDKISAQNNDNKFKDLLKAADSGLLTSEGLDLTAKQLDHIKKLSCF